MALRFHLTDLFELVAAKVPDRIALADEFGEAVAACSVKTAETPPILDFVKDFCRTLLAVCKLHKVVKAEPDLKRSPVGMQNYKYAKSVFAKDTYL